MKLYLVFLLLIVVACHVSCSDETLQSKPFGFVITNPVQVRSDGATLSGNLLDLGKAPIRKYGFIVTDASNPAVKSFLPAEEPTPRLGEYSLTLTGGLQKDHIYQVSAFLEEGNHLVLGNVESFKALGSQPPRISSFSPQKGPVGTIVEIVGDNFGLIRSGLVVKFGSTECVVDTILKDRIRVIVPDVTEGGSMNISVEAGGIATTSSSMFDLWFPWTRKADFPGSYLWLVSSFEAKGKIWVLGGLNVYPWQVQNEFWVYDPKVDSWSQKSSFPGKMRYEAIAFSCNGKAYYGLGKDPGYLSDFWEYDPDSDSWTQLEYFPGRVTDHMRSFSIQDKGYAASVYYDQTNAYSYSTEFWEFNAHTKKWSRKGDFPAGRQYGLSLGSPTRGYLGLGTNGWKFDDIYSYDPSSDSWTLLGIYPGNGWNAVGSFLINEKMYAGMGSDNSTNTFADFWEFDLATHEWKQMHSSPTKLAPSVSISVGSKGYVGYGWYNLSSEDTYMGRRFYEFDPTKN